MSRESPLARLLCSVRREGKRYADSPRELVPPCVQQMHSARLGLERVWKVNHIVTAGKHCFYYPSGTDVCTSSWNVLVSFKKGSAAGRQAGKLMEVLAFTKRSLSVHPRAQRLT